jgi:hypothetical protein
MGRRYRSPGPTPAALPVSDGSARLYGSRTCGRLLQGLLHSHDSEIATESRRDTSGPSPTQGHIVDVDWKGARMRKRVLLISGLSLAVVGVFGAGYTFRDLAKGITEAPSHWWSTAPWIAIGLGVGPTCAGADLRPATDILLIGANSTGRRAPEPPGGPAGGSRWRSRRRLPRGVTSATVRQLTLRTSAMSPITPTTIPRMRTAASM